MRAGARRFSHCMRLIVPALVLAIGSPIGGSSAAAQDPGPLVFTNANVVDAVSARPIPNAAVVVRDGRIERVERGGIEPSDGTRVIDLGGMYLLPGFIDAHVHISTVAAAERALLSGVTTARSAGGAFFQDVGLRELASGGTIRSPELLAAGWHVRPEPGDAFFIDEPAMADLREGGLRGAEAMRRAARVMAENGVDWVKVTATDRAGLPTTDPRNTLYSEAELRALVEEAAANGDRKSVV